MVWYHMKLDAKPLLMYKSAYCAVHVQVWSYAVAAMLVLQDCIYKFYIRRIHSPLPFDRPEALMSIV